jgi:Skp family chaperone for outer membrane proteins
MASVLKMIKITAVALIAFLGLGTALEAQILIVDDERVEREAAAYKDFNLQVNELRQNIVQLRQFVSRGGQVEQLMADLEQRKSIIGNDKYEEEKKGLETQFVNAQRALQISELQFDKLRQEAATQVERARQPVIRQILADRNAQIIMIKRLVMGSASGIDVTTEFIEQLDAELPAVSLTLPQRSAAQPAAATPTDGN